MTPVEIQIVDYSEVQDAYPDMDAQFAVIISNERGDFDPSFCANQKEAIAVAQEFADAYGVSPNSLWQPKS